MLFNSGSEVRGYLLDELGDMSHLILVEDYTVSSGEIVYIIGDKSGLISDFSSRDSLLSNIKGLLKDEMAIGKDGCLLGKVINVIMGIDARSNIDTVYTKWFELNIKGNRRVKVSINYLGDDEISVGYYYIYDGDADDGSYVGKTIKYKLSDTQTIPGILKEVEQLNKIVDYHKLVKDVVRDLHKGSLINRLGYVVI